jgi:hypothetical protein
MARRFTGSYLLLGTSVSLRSSAGAQPTIATISGNSLTIVEPGMISVFTK